MKKYYTLEHLPPGTPLLHLVERGNMLSTCAYTRSKWWKVANGSNQTANEDNKRKDTAEQEERTGANPR